VVESMKVLIENQCGLKDDSNY